MLSLTRVGFVSALNNNRYVFEETVYKDGKLGAVSCKLLTYDELRKMPKYVWDAATQSLKTQEPVYWNRKE